MGNTTFINDRRVCVKLLKDRIEATQKLKSLTTLKGGKSFAGMVNFFKFVLSRITNVVKTNI